MTILYEQCVAALGKQLVSLSACLPDVAPPVRPLFGKISVCLKVVIETVVTIWLV